MSSKSVNQERRGLLKSVGAVSASAALPCQTAFGKELPAGTAISDQDLKRFRSSCAMECLHCNLTAFVKDGKVVKIRTSDGMNVKGCKRGISRTRWIDHPDRIKSPMLRVGEKGSGQFKPISWDEALDLIEVKIRETIKTHGNKGLLLTTASGNMDSITNAVAGDFFQHIGGCTRTVGSLCCSAVTAAMEGIVGFRYTDTRDTIADSKYLICWGNNPAVTMQAYWKEFLTAKSHGAKLIVIDPRFSETAAKADQWIPINPGTDIALALGMMRVIFKEKLYKAEFLAAHTGAPYLVDAKGELMRADAGDKLSFVVFDNASKSVQRHDAAGVRPALTLAGVEGAPAGANTVLQLVMQAAEEWTPERTQAETDVPAATVVKLAREYARSPASMIIQNMSGAQRTEFGTYVAASQFYLALLTGQIGRAGTGVDDTGGVHQMLKLKGPVKPPARKPDAVPPIPTAKLGAWVLEGRPHPIGFWYSMTCSPMTQWPNTAKVKAALKKVPFVVVADNLMTSTARLADLVLPVTTIFESTSLMAGHRSHYIQLMEKAVEPAGLAQPDYWIFAQLAKRFGCADVFDKPVEEHIKTILDGSGVEIEQLRQAPVRPWKGPFIPFANGQFRTPTKKAHFFVEAWAAKKFSPIVVYRRPSESPKGTPELAQRFPLMAIQRKLSRSIHSSHGTNPWLMEMDRSHPEVVLHPADAAARNIRNGDKVAVFNERGQHLARAQVTENIKRGVVCLENGWWEEQGGSSSYVSNDGIEILGNGTMINSTLVNVRKEA